MADVQSNIHVNIDTSDALASLKLLQRQISAFHTQMSKSGTSAAAVAANQAQNLINSINATGKFQASMRTVTSSTEAFTDSLERNKLTSREYFRYTGAATKTFGRLFKSEFETINKVARERVKDIQTQYIKLGRGANGALQAIAVRPLALDMKDLGTQTAMAAQKQQLLNQLLKQGSTNLLNFGKNTQWAGRQLMVGFTVPLVMLGSAAAKTFMQMEEQAIRFKRVYGELFTTQEETDAMVKQIQTLAKEYTKYGVAVEETMKMAADAAAMGKMGAELTAQVAQATRLAVLGGVEQAQALETTISITNAFGIAAEDLAKKIDFLNSVENQTVVSIEDLTIAIPKAGPVVQQLGGDVEDLAFFLTAMKEGGINASEGANALKSGLASLINPSEKASKMLMGLGVNIKGIVEANKGDVTKTVVGFAQALDTLDPLNRARAIEQLFGKFQFSRLSTLFQNVTAQGTQASKVLGLAQATTEELAILSQRELDKIENTTTYKFKKSIENLKVAIAPVGEQFLKALTPIVEFAAKILEKFDSLGDGSKKFLTILTVALGAIGPIALMTFGLLANGIANIIKLFATMKAGFNKAGSVTQVLGQQTDYLTQQQLEASAVAASLDQVHQKLKQTFTSETAAVNMLANAYQRAIAAQAGFTGPTKGSAKTKGLKKYSVGTGKVPGTGNQDTVPAMLTPGEAVIPAGAAQDPANKPVIARMIAGQTVQGFNSGEGDVQEAGKNTKEVVKDNNVTNKTHVGGKSTPKNIQDVIDSNPHMTADQRNKLITMSQIFKSQGMDPMTTTKHGLIFDFPEWMNKVMPTVGVSKQEFIDEWQRRGAGKWSPSGMTAIQAQALDDAFLKSLLEVKGPNITDEIVDKIFKDEVPKRISPNDEGLKKAQKLYATDYLFNMGKGLGNTPEKSTEILQNAKDKGFIKDFKIETGLGTGEGRKDKVVTKSSTVTLNDGTVVNMNRLGAGTTPGISQKPAGAPVKAPELILENMEKARSQEATLKAIADEAAKTKTGKKKPTDFGKQIAGTSGRSFDVKELGGIFEKPGGQKVFVKPMMNELDALAEKKATDFAREVQGLDAPKQTIRTMLDPTDPTGKRKIIVLESKFDDKFDPKNMPKKFTQEEYFKQLVSANLRGDKDLKADNLGGNRLTDVGNAGVFDKASGKRVILENMPSLEQMAEENLKGLPEKSKANPRNSPNWFANATKDIALNLTPDQYQRAMEKEINRQIAQMEPWLKKMPDSDPLKPQYTKMLERLKAGLGVDWKRLHQKHSSILVKPDEVQEDDKGRTKPIPTEPNNGKFKSDSGTKDTRIASKEVAPSVRQRPRLRGKANAPETSGSVATAVVSGAKGSIAEAKAVGANIGTTISQSAAAASRTMLYGTGPVDADAKSLRRQLEKRQRAEAKTQAKINANKTAMYGTTGPIDAVMRGRRKHAEREMKRSNLAEKVAYQERIISEKAAAEAKSKTVSGRITSFASKRADARQKRIDAGKKTGMGMGGALGIASGAAMIGSMAPGKVGEISQKVMMPLMGLSMILPMMRSPMAAVAVGLTATVGAFVALRMAFDKAADKVLQESEKFKGSSSAVNSLAEFGGKVTASEQMDLRRKNSFSMLGPARGKTTYGEAFVQTKDGQALTKRISEQNAAGKGNVAAKDLSGQLSAAIMSGAMDMGQAKSLAMNAARQAGDMSIGIKVIGQLESILGPNGERLEKEPLQVRMDMVAQNSKTMQSSIDSVKGADPITKLAGQKTMQKVGIGASAIGGAAAGAGIGGMIGGALGAVGGPLAVITAGIGATIGAGIGAAVGGIGAYFASKKFTKQAGTLGAAAAVDAKIAMEQNKQMLDSFDMYYQKKVEELRLQGKINEADALQTKYIKERNDLTAAQGKLQADVVSQYEGAGGLQESMMSGMKKASTARYKDDPNQLAYLDVVNQQAGDLRSSGLISKGQEYLIQAKMASGDIPPAVFRSLLGLAADNKDIAPKMMEIITKFSGATSESIGVAAQNILGADDIVNKEVQTAFITRVEAFEKDSDALDFAKNIIKLNNLNAVIPSDVMVSYYTDPKNQEAYDSLNKMLDSIEGKKDLTATFVYEIMPEVKGTAAFDEAYFNTLTEDQQKVYTTTIASLINVPEPKIIESEDFKAWRKETGPKGGAGITGSKSFIVQKYIEAQGNKAVTDNVQINANAPATTGGGGGGGNKVQSSPLDDLVKKLRDVRKNQIKVTEGWSASRKALDGLFGGKKTIDVFSGIENDLRGLGGSQDFIELIVGMDPKEYEKRKNSLFKFDNKGNIIALKEDAKNIQEALNSITMGDWNSDMESQLKTIENQSVAFDKLSKLGVPVADAYELISNKAIAASIANGVNEKTLNTLIGKYKVLTVAQERAAAVEGVKKDTAQFKKDRLQEDRLKNLRRGDGAQLDDVGAFAVKSDENLAALDNSIASQVSAIERLRKKKITSKYTQAMKNDEIEKASDALADSIAQFEERLGQLKSTIGLYEDIFNEVYDKGMDMFAVREQAFQIQFEINTDQLSKDIEQAQNEIALIQYNVDDKEAALKAIEDQEQKINERYDERIEALNKVEAANAAINAQQKSQLTLAEALTSGDIAAAARAAQDMRAQAAADAVIKQKDALEQSRKNELSQATGLDKTDNNYKTRKQLEEEIKKLQDDIFKKEEETIEPKQEKIRLEEVNLKKQIDGIKVADMTKLEWEKIRSEVEMSRIGVKGYEESLKKAVGYAEDLKKLYAGEKLLPKYQAPIVGATDEGSDPNPKKEPKAEPKPEPNPKPEPDPKPDVKTCPPGTRLDANGNCTPNSTVIVPPTPKAEPKPCPPGTKSDGNGNCVSLIPPILPPILPKADPKPVVPSYKDDDKNGIPDLIQKPPTVMTPVPGTGIPGTGSVAKAFPPIMVPRPVVPAPKDLDKNGIPDNIQAPPKKAAPKSLFTMPAGLGKGYSMGGIVRRFALGGFAKGTDTVPAMLTPGEFVMSKYAVDSYGVDNMKKINNGDSVGGTVYNNTYTLTVNAKTDANPNEIAQAVMSTIKKVDDRRIRGVSLNGR
jgi:TP901 family phage tail tape measure protein